MQLYQFLHYKMVIVCQVLLLLDESGYVVLRGCLATESFVLIIIHYRLFRSEHAKGDTGIPKNIQ